MLLIVIWLVTHSLQDEIWWSNYSDRNNFDLDSYFVSHILSALGFISTLFLLSLLRMISTELQRTYVPNSKQSFFLSFSSFSRTYLYFVGSLTFYFREHSKYDRLMPLRSYFCLNLSLTTQRKKYAFSKLKNLSERNLNIIFKTSVEHLRKCLEILRNSWKSESYSFF